MGSVYSKSLAAAGVAVTTSVDLYTSPTGVTTVVRDVEWYNAGASTSHLILYMSAANAVLWSLDAAAATWKQWVGRIVLPPGAVLKCVCTVQPYTIVVSGYELT